MLADKRSKRRSVLDPIDRLTEITFGLLMTLTFTGTMSVAVGAGGDVRSVLAAALGCNIAWGLIDGVLFVLFSVTERGRAAADLAALQRAPDAELPALVRGLLPPPAGDALSDAEARQAAGWLRRVSIDPSPAAIDMADLRAALAIALLVVGSTIPPSLPFLLFQDLPTAMRVSNLVAVAMLVAIGFQLDRLMASPRWVMRLVLPVAGVILVAVTIALGG